MNASHAIRLGLEMADFVCQAYLADLTDEQLMMRPCEGTNHLNWQIGHLIRSEHELISMVAPVRCLLCPPDSRIVMPGKPHHRTIPKRF